MRHRNIKGRLSRSISLRKATLKSLANDLFTYQRIETTKAKAKALRSFAEPLITMAKKNPDSVSARRLVFSRLCDRTVVKSLFDDIAPLYKDVAGGYTRIMALGNRKGDGAEMAIMELTKRTISDEKLLGKDEAKPKARAKVKPADKKAEPGEKARGKDLPAKAPGKKGHAAPEVDIAEKEKRAVEDVRKKKAKTEQEKVSKKGIFRRFQRKSMG
jgi:large subunit ribosomal protein L17